MHARHIGRMGRRLALGGVAALLAATPAAAVGVRAPASSPRIVTSTGGPPHDAGFRRTPREVIYSGDGSAFIAGPGHSSPAIVWSSWNAPLGRGLGADWHDNCIPDCARGHFTAYRAMITVYRPRRVGGYLLFTRMDTAFTGARPPYPGFRHATVTYRLLYQASSHAFFWSFP